MNKLTNKNINDFKRLIFGIISFIIIIFFVLLFYYSKQFQTVEVEAATTTITGTYSVFIEEDFIKKKSKNTPVLVKNDKSVVPLGNLAKIPKNTKPGDTIKVTGVFNKKSIFNIRKATTTSSPKSKSSTLSQINVRVIPVNLKNTNTNAFTSTQLLNVLNGSNNPINVDKFMQKVSKGRFKLAEVKIDDWYKLDTSSIPTEEVCDVFTVTEIINQINSQFNANVYNPKYQSLIFLIDADCYRGGRADSRFETGQGYIYLSVGAYKEGVIIHEMGHNLDIHHANSYDCGAESYALQSKCTTKEYGNPFSVLGLDVYDSLFREFSGAERVKAGWINSSEITKVTQNGNYTIYPLSENSNQPKVLEIIKNDISPDERYYIDFRLPNDPFDKLDNDLYDGGDVTGVGIQTTFTQTYNPDNPLADYLRHTQIIDTKPGSFSGYNEHYKDFLDARLTQVGQEYFDKVNGIKIKIISINNQKVEVSVDFQKPNTENSNLITFRGKSSTPLLKAQLHVRDSSTGKFNKVKDFNKTSTSFSTYSFTDSSGKVINPEDVRVSFNGFDPQFPNKNEYFELLWLEINNTRYNATDPQVYATGVWNKSKQKCSPSYPNLYPVEYETPTRLSCPDKYFQFKQSPNLPVKLKNSLINASCNLANEPEVLITWDSEKNSTNYFVEYCEGSSCNPTIALDGVPEDSGQDGIRRFYAHLDDPFGLTPPPLPGKTYRYRVQGAKYSNGEFLVGIWSDVLTVTVPTNICK